MPFMRRVIQSPTSEASNAQTKVVKLPRSGALSGLMLRASMTNGATSGRAVKMLDVIDTVEVVADGSKPIISLNSDELLRWQRYWTKSFNHLVVTEAAAGVQRWFMPLLFGRYLGDPQYWLPLSNFSDLELRVAYSPTIAADSGFATGTFELEVMGWIQDSGTPSQFSGFFRTLNKYNNSTAASGDLQIELPRGKPYRAVMVYAHESGVAMHTDLSRVQLILNDGAITYLDALTFDLVRENHYMLGLKPEYQGQHLSQGAETMETLLDYIEGVVITEGAVATIGTTETPHTFITTLTGGLITPQGVLKDGDATQGADIAENADHAKYVFAKGIGLGKAVVIDFEDYINQGTPWNSEQFSKINLILTQAGADAQLRVSLSELVQGV